MNPQIKYNLPAAEYHAIEAASSSALKSLAIDGPAKFAYEREYPKSTPAMELGTAIHTAVLEPELFDAQYVVEPTFSGKGSVAARAEWREAHAGEITISESDLAICQGCATAIANHKQASAILTGKREVSLFWTDDATGVPCKARLDCIGENGAWVADHKTAIDASERGFARAVANLRYHIQAWWYLHAVEVTMGVKPDTFCYVAQEKVPPFLIGLYEMDAASLQQGQFEAEYQLQVYAECSKAGVWPGYEERAVTIGLPAWYYRQ